MFHFINFFFIYTKYYDKWKTSIRKPKKKTYLKTKRNKSVGLLNKIYSQKAY